MQLAAHSYTALLLSASVKMDFHDQFPNFPVSYRSNESKQISAWWMSTSNLSLREQNAARSPREGTTKLLLFPFSGSQSHIQELSRGHSQKHEDQRGFISLLLSSPQEKQGRLFRWTHMYRSYAAPPADVQSTSYPFRWASLGGKKSSAEAVWKKSFVGWKKKLKEPRLL